MTFVPYDRPVRAAFIGLGRIYDLNVRAYIDNPDVEVVALVDPSEERRAQRQADWPGACTFASAAELASRSMRWRPCCRFSCMPTAWSNCSAASIRGSPSDSSWARCPAGLAARGITLLRPSRKDEQARHGEAQLKTVRQLIESVNDTLKGQLDLEAHGGRTFEGVAIRVAQRILAMAAAIWHNNNTSQPVTRSLIAYH